MNFEVPSAKYALIGGSGTWGLRFPEDLKNRDVKLLEIYDQGFETPYGRTASFKLLEIADEKVLRVAMHGRKYNENGIPENPQWVVSKQIASIFKEAGTKWILVESSVGGIQKPDKLGEPLPPWSVVITDDFMNMWNVPTVKPNLVNRNKVYRYKEPFCSSLRDILYKHAFKEEKFKNVFDHGVYLCTPWGRFETSAEIKAYAKLGAHVVGQTLTHEAPLMRRLGIHFGSLSIVSNYAEGVFDEWVGNSTEGLRNFYYECAPVVANVMVNAMMDIIVNGTGDCHCDNFVLEGQNSFPVSGA